MDTEQAHVIQRLQQLEQEVIEQVVARRLAEQALAEAQGRIAQLTQTFQQGTRVSGQVVDTRVLRKSDKWDGSQKSVVKLELRREGLCRSHRSAVVGRHDESGGHHDCPV